MRKVLFLLVGLLMFNCLSQKPDKNDGGDSITSTKIRELIKEKRFSILQNAEMVVRINISKTLIDGSTDEYYNKLTILDTLNKAEATAFKNSLQNDETYNWEVPAKEPSFDPQQQFLLKGKGAQLRVLLDSRSKLLGFIDLYGQELIAIKGTIYFQ